MALAREKWVKYLYLAMAYEVLWQVWKMLRRTRTLLGLEHRGSYSCQIRTL